MSVVLYHKQFKALHCTGSRAAASRYRFLGEWGRRALRDLLIGPVLLNRLNLDFARIYIYVKTRSLFFLFSLALLNVL